MRHEITLEGSAFRLRPITYEDAALVVQLRTHPILGRFLHPTSNGVDQQLAWLAQYYERLGDYYFVVERIGTSIPEGVISIYDVDTQSDCGEWGRWILRPQSLAAVESALLIYRCAFEFLNLNTVYCRTMATNLSVVSFHDSCGLTDRKCLYGHFKMDGNNLDAIQHTIHLTQWPAVQKRLEKLATLTARRLLHA